MSDYLRKRQQHILQGRPLPEKKSYSIPKKSEKRKQKELEQKAAGGESALDKWFEGIEKKYCGEHGYTFCMECGAVVPQTYIRHATAHLLPKKLFKSIATHELNYLILGAGCGCHEKTHRVDKFVKMKVWPEAARRIKIMMEVLPIDELRHISSQLLIELDKIS